MFCVTLTLGDPDPKWDENGMGGLDLLQQNLYYSDYSARCVSVSCLKSIF